MASPDTHRNNRWPDQNRDTPWAPGPGPNRPSPAGRPGEEIGGETAIIKLGHRGTPKGSSGGGGGETSVPFYFRAYFEPRPPSYTARIFAIYALTLALQAVLFVAYGESSRFLASPEQDRLWWVGTGFLLLTLLPALSGIVVDHPESVWARRWMYVTYVGCALVGVCGVASFVLLQLT